MPALLRLLLAPLLVAGLAGCDTLLKDEEPFEILVVSDLRDPWSGAIVVETADGEQVFRKPVTITTNSIRTAYHIGALEGEHMFAAESGGRRWETTRLVHEGDSLTYVIRSATEVCFDFRQDTGSAQVCDPEGA